MKTTFNFEKVIDRAKKLLIIKHDYELAEILGMKPGAFNARKKANSLPYEELLLLADTEKIDFNWLLTGEGEIYRANSRPNPVSDHSAHTILGLYESLNEDQQKEILTIIKDKKRINELIEIVNSLQNRVW